MWITVAIYVATIAMGTVPHTPIQPAELPDLAVVGRFLVAFKNLSPCSRSRSSESPRRYDPVMDLIDRPGGDTALIAAAAAFLVAVAVVPAILLIAGAIGIWGAVAIYVATTTLVTIASETFQRLH